MAKHYFVGSDITGNLHEYAVSFLPAGVVVVKPRNETVDHLAIAEFTYRGNESHFRVQHAFNHPHFSKGDLFLKTGVVKGTQFRVSLPNASVKMDTTKQGSAVNYRLEPRVSFLSINPAQVYKDFLSFYDAIQHSTQIHLSNVRKNLAKAISEEELDLLKKAFLDYDFDSYAKLRSRNTTVVPLISSSVERLDEESPHWKFLDDRLVELEAEFKQRKNLVE